MSVGVESQCYIECDACGEIEVSSVYSLKDWKHKMRNEYGWSIGKVVLCPDCASKYRNRRRRNEHAER